jgi:hypothetical protein
MSTGILVVAALFFAWHGDIWEGASGDRMHALWSLGALAATTMSLATSWSFAARPHVELLDDIVPNWKEGLHQFAVVMVAGSLLCIYIFVIFTVPYIVRFRMEQGQK